MARRSLLADLLAEQKLTNDLLRAWIDAQTKRRPAAKKGT